MNTAIIKIILGAGFAFTGVSLIAGGVKEYQSKPSTPEVKPAKKQAKKVVAKQSQQTPKEDPKPAPKADTPPADPPPAETTPKEKELDDTSTIDNN